MQTVLDEFSERIRDAAACGRALRIRGGGSKDFHGQRLHGELLETAALRGIVSYQPTELVVTAYAGTALAELEATLGASGQSLPFEPPYFAPNAQGGSASVGGMVAAGLSGPARASVGAVRDHVLGVKLINGRGEQLTFGGQVMKNVAGYDISRLMVGAMGTLGLLTEVSLKVAPLSAAQATLRFEVDQAGALAQLHRWGGLPLPLNASCWFRDPAAVGPGWLYLRLRGARAAVDAACSRMLQELAGQAMDGALAAAHWQAVRDLQLPFFQGPQADGLALWRLSLPQTTPVLDLPWPQCIEWHGGLRWLRAPQGAAAQLRDAARKRGGHASIFQAAADARAADVARFTPLEQPLLGIHQRLKREFDPAGVLNPGRMYAEF